MIPKSMSSTLIGDGNRFSDQIMLKKKERAPYAAACRRNGDAGESHITREQQERAA
jgi:hypothetical protein